ncbi:MAG: hypothetical protein KC423_29745 [Anaerolineales bacterium]|nr:hypothetical protein [Anaerolineales bacterium]
MFVHVCPLPIRELKKNGRFGVLTVEKLGENGRFWALHVEKLRGETAVCPRSSVFVRVR